MIKFLDLQKITQKYSEEIHTAVARVIDSGWYLQGLKTKDLSLCIQSISGRSIPLDVQTDWMH
jgi:dTDP-4-amino-4,6-dideoxygalactose transaminase